jgi:hypothetical protein
VDSGCEHLGSECGHAARMGGVGFLVSDVQFLCLYKRMFVKTFGFVL